ncbi:MAG: hypothetical protein WC624_02970, partial [Candidatus Margulisiibacteriota bacterium]
VSNLMEPFSGIRIARGEQTRENFYINNAKQNTGTSTELITSMNIFAGLRGNNKATPLSFGYSALVLYPMSVSTTNNLLPGFNFGASGYTLSLSGNASYCVFGGSFLVCEIGYGLVHYSGSGWAVQGQQQAQWPINDTQDLNVTLGWTSDL